MAASVIKFSSLAKTKAVQMDLNNDWLTSQGLVSVQQQWLKFHS